MESKSVDKFIFIGTAIRYLQDVVSGPYQDGVGGILWNYEELLKWLSGNHMNVSVRATRNILGPIMREVEKIQPREGLIEIPDELAERISDSTGQLRETIFAETQGFDAFVVTDKRYPVESLLHGVDKLMAPGVFDSLTELARFDFTQAGRAIAFELPTAAAFYLMRGTEEVLRNFYRAIVKQNRVNPLLWGPMVNGLRNRKRNPPPTVLLNNLDSLRINFRNPTQHPEKIYDIDEVQDLLSLSIDVVNRMNKHLGT